MTKYEEFIQKHGSLGFVYKEQFKQELDEVIIEKLHEFADWHNSHSNSHYFTNSYIDRFLQNKEE
jgi:hypothetical protein